MAKADHQQTFIRNGLMKMNLLVFIPDLQVPRTLKVVFVVFQVSDVKKVVIAFHICATSSLT